jgi:hypothetical protein
MTPFRIGKCDQFQEQSGFLMPDGGVVAQRGLTIEPSERRLFVACQIGQFIAPVGVAGV